MVTCDIKVYTHQQYDAQIDCNEQTYEGIVSKKNDNIFIIYKEQDQETGIKITNQLKVGQDESISVRRMGNVKSLLYFKEGTPYRTPYNTGQGMVDLVFTPTVVTYQEIKNAYKIELKYAIYMGDTKLSDNVYMLQATPKR